MNRKERIKKAIKFFRNFKEKSNKEIYRRSVLRFCDLVEEELFGSDDDKLIETAEEVFKDL